MAKPRLRAVFFIRPNGDIISKAPPINFQQRKRIWERDNKRCNGCGVATSLFRWAMQGTPFNRSGIEQSNIDHILPRSRGGQNNDNNLQLLCLSCNMSKGAK